MKGLEEVTYDLDFTKPRVVVSNQVVILENVAGIVMLSETSITVCHGFKSGGNHLETGKRRRSKSCWFTTITGLDFTIKEIYEGRLLVEGTIQGVEFLQSQGGSQD